MVRSPEKHLLGFWNVKNDVTVKQIFSLHEHEDTKILNWKIYFIQNALKTRGQSYLVETKLWFFLAFYWKITAGSQRWLGFRRKWIQFIFFESNEIYEFLC